MSASDPQSWTLDNWRNVSAYLRWHPSCPHCSAADVLFAATEAPQPNGVAQAMCDACGHAQTSVNRGYDVLDLLSSPD